MAPSPTVGIGTDIRFVANRDRREGSTLVSILLAEAPMVGMVKTVEVEPV